MQSIGRIYECECKESIKVTERNTVISNVTGKHISAANNSVVGGIHIIGASYLPNGIETFFPNLIGLSVEQHLKEITKSDLKPFPKLKHVWLARNQLEAIEDDLFKYNPDLIYISLRQNFIKEIGPNVFNQLDKLTILELDRNECVNENAVGRYAVARLIEQLNEKCTVESIETMEPLPTKTEIKVSPEELLYDREILTEKLHFWKSFSIVLLSIMAIVTVVVIGVIIKRYGGSSSVVKFVSFRKS